jgi:hypothetical protein
VAGGWQRFRSSCAPNNYPDKEQMYCNENNAADPKRPGELAVIGKCGRSNGEWKPDRSEKEKKTRGDKNQQKSGAEQQTLV